MTEPAATTVAPAVTTPATPAPSPAPVNQDTYGDRTIKLSQIPIAGYEKHGQFTPAGETQPEPAPAPEPAADVNADPVNEDGKPNDTTTAQPATATLKANNGREFKDSAEMLATYNASLPEVKRLVESEKALKVTADDVSSKLNEANATILAMQEYIGNAAYAPNVPEKYKGMNETDMIAAMTDMEKLDYRLDQREWGKKVEGFKSQMANAKTESEAIAARIVQESARAEATMSQDKAQYPDFTELSPLRTEIIKNSPHLANRPDSHYVTYYMAMGIAALNEKAAAVRLETESRATAAGEANAAATAAGTGGAPASQDKPAPKNDGLRGLVNAAKVTKGTF